MLLYNTGGYGKPFFPCESRFLLVVTKLGSDRVESQLWPLLAWPHNNHFDSTNLIDDAHPSSLPAFSNTYCCQQHCPFLPKWEWKPLTNFRIHSHETLVSRFRCRHVHLLPRRVLVKGCTVAGCNLQNSTSTHIYAHAYVYIHAYECTDTIPVFDVKQIVTYCITND